MEYNIGTKIRELRIRYGMTQEQVAEKVGCDRETINRYENHKITNPKSVYLGRLAKLFNVSIDYFLEEENESEERKDC